MDYSQPKGASWSLGMDLHPCHLIHHPKKKKRYCMEIYYQVLVFYLLLINAES